MEKLPVLNAQDAYTVKSTGVTHATYADHARERLFVEDDGEAVHVLGKFRQDPTKMRILYAAMLVEGLVAGRSVFERFKNDMSADFVATQALSVSSASLFTAEELLLRDLASRVGNLRSESLSDYGLPTPSGETDEIAIARATFGRDKCRERADASRGKTTSEQSDAANIILRAYNSGGGGVFYLQAAAGRGETFLIEYILDTVRGDGGLACATASIASRAIEFTGGRTAHSLWGVPVEEDDVLLSSLGYMSERAKYIRARVACIR